MPCQNSLIHSTEHAEQARPQKAHDQPAMPCLPPIFIDVITTFPSRPLPVMLPSTCSSWLKYSDDAYEFLSTYRHLIDFHANDYYTGALWYALVGAPCDMHENLPTAPSADGKAAYYCRERIDPTWRPYLAQATKDELHGCLAGGLACLAT